MFKPLLASRVVITLLLVGGFPASASGDHSWEPYHWARTSNPFTLKLGDNLSDAWDPYLATTSSDWSLASELNTTIVPGKTATNVKRCRATSGRVEVCNTTYGNNGWLGIAQIWITGTHITQATTKVNDTYFNTSTYNTPAWRRLVMCQEIAHDFALDHQDEIFDNPNLGSCMDYTSNPDGPPSNEYPNQHDYDQLETIYVHLDGTTTVASSTLPKAMPPAMGQIGFDTPAQWGRLVRSNANGRVQIYELDFGRGHKVITHVFWADPAADAQH